MRLWRPAVMASKIAHRPQTWILAAVLILLCFLQGSVRTLLLGIIRAPFTTTSAAVKILVDLPRIPSLRGENRRLKRLLAKRTQEAADLREALRKQAAASTLQEILPKTKGVIASVTLRSPIPGHEMVLLNRGVESGIVSETLLVDAHGVVGRVIESNKGSSLAMLITDPNSRLAAVNGRSRETGLLVGLDQRRCELIYLEADADILEGDRILTAGVGLASSRKGMLLGTVVSIDRDRQSGSAKAVIEPAADLSRLEEVLCLLPLS